MQDAKQPFPHFLGREGRNTSERREDLFAGNGRRSSELREESSAWKPEIALPRQGSSGALPYRGRRGGTGYDTGAYCLWFAGQFAGAGGIQSGNGAGGGTQEAIGCDEHPWKNKLEPLFLSPPPLDFLLFLESLHIGQVRQRVDNS